MGESDVGNMGDALSGTAGWISAVSGESEDEASPPERKPHSDDCTVREGEDESPSSNGGEGGARASEVGWLCGDDKKPHIVKIFTKEGKLTEFKVEVGNFYFEKKPLHRSHVQPTQLQN
jgi:hypothetical protein